MMVVWKQVNALQHWKYFGAPGRNRNYNYHKFPTKMLRRFQPSQNRVWMRIFACRWQVKIAKSDDRAAERHASLCATFIKWGDEGRITTVKDLKNCSSYLRRQLFKCLTVVIRLSSACLIKPNFYVSLSHRRSTTVSLETRKFFLYVMSHFGVKMTLF